MKLFMLTNTFNEEKQNDKNYFKNYIIKYGKKFGYEEIQIKYPLLNQILFGDENIETVHDVLTSCKFLNCPAIQIPS